MTKKNGNDNDNDNEVEVAWKVSIEQAENWEKSVSQEMQYSANAIVNFQWIWIMVNWKSRWRFQRL